MLSKRAQAIAPSATLAVAAKAKQMKADGLDVLSFSAGEPDYSSPEEAKQAAIKALNENFTYYTNASGITELKKAIVDKFKRDNDIEYTEEDICVSLGGKKALHNIFQVLIDPGDEVILPTPYWVSYDEQIKLAGGKTVFCKTNNHFKLTAEIVKKYLTDKTKIVVVNTPSNPTGAVIEKSELEKIGQLAVKNNFFIISDEVYEFFVYGGDKHFSMASISPEVKKRVLTVNAVSKTYSMTGWRIGYTGGPRDIIKAMHNLQSHTTSNPCSFAQKGALASLNSDQSRVLEMVNEFKDRGNYFSEELNKLPYFECNKPEGAFYIFAKIPGKKSVEFCEQLLEKANIAMVPGVAFGQDYDEYVRISFASSRQDIDKALERLKEINI